MSPDQRADNHPQLMYRRLASLADLKDPVPIIVPICEKDTVVAEHGENLRFLNLDEPPAQPVARSNAVWHEIARWGNHAVVAGPAESEELDAWAGETGVTRDTYRNLFPRLGAVEFGLLARAIQIVEWDRTSRHCSACGSATEVPEIESVARCPDCGHVQYPRVSPAMIVAIVREGRLLLARSSRFRGSIHSVLAGFVEPGESVEECIHREVWEEARIKVKNLRYFGSQSWPFPHSLMLAFTAEWAGGEIRIDEEEIERADWYLPEEMPPVPSELSIAGRMIRWFSATYA